MVLFIFAANGSDAAGESKGEDWLTFRHDYQRSGVTKEHLAPPLYEQWVFEPPFPPAEGWPEAEDMQLWQMGANYERKAAYDDAFQVAISGNTVCFASSSENKIYSIDATKGVINWVYYTDASPRLAPTIWQEKVYTGCDDGYVYCLSLKTGKQLWKFKAFAKEEMIIGMERLMSAWPVRTSVVVENDKAYFGAGLFPNEGMSLCSVSADNGQLNWKRDYAAGKRGGIIVPEGYILSTKDRFIIPSGRVNPGVFDKDGKVTISIAGGGGSGGGTFTMIHQNILFNGTQSMVAFDLMTKEKKLFKYGEMLGAYSLYPAYRLVVYDDTIYFADKKELRAVDYNKVLEVVKLKHTLKDYLWQTRNKRGKAPKDDPMFVEIKKQEDEIHKNEKWHVLTETCDSLIIAGNMVYAGGQEKVVAVDRKTGRQSWSGKVDGRVCGLAVAHGRLYASTTAGKIYCFAESETKSQKISPVIAQTPYAKDKRSELYSGIAASISKEATFKRGWALIIGGESAHLAHELSKLTEMQICVVEPDMKKAENMRRRLGEAGLYGGRITVVHSNLSALPFRQYLFNLVITGESIVGGKISTPADELLRVLSPCGGIAYAGKPDSAKGNGEEIKSDSIKKWLSGIKDSTVKYETKNLWVTITRGKLENTDEWTHQTGSARNTYSNDDTLVKPPFKLLWFGRPGAKMMIERHSRGPAPLFHNGIMFVQGKSKIVSHDAYNGTFLWERGVPKVGRYEVNFKSGNMVAAKNSLFYLADNKCIRIDGRTGRQIAEYIIPGKGSGGKYRWAWLATDGETLFGSEELIVRKSWRDSKVESSQHVFAKDIETGKDKWVYSGKSMVDAGFAIGDGKVYLLDKTEDISSQQREAAIAERIQQTGESKAPIVDRKGVTEERDVRLLVALNMNNGEKIWSTGVDVTYWNLHGKKYGGIGGPICVMYQDKSIVICGMAFHGNHHLKEHKDGDFKRRGITALSSDTGKMRWVGFKNYLTRPVVAAGKIYAEPYIYDLKTGKEDGAISRGYGGCGGFAASNSMLFFSAKGIAFAKLEDQAKYASFQGQKAGCWVNSVPAGGLLITPEGSSGCSCPNPFQATFVLHPAGKE